MIRPMRCLLSATSFLLPLQVLGSPTPPSQSAQAAVALEGAEVPAYVCFTAILERDPRAIVPAVPHPTSARAAWDLTGKELDSLARSQRFWVDSSSRISFETGTESEVLEATTTLRDETFRESFRQIQLDGLRRKVDAAFDALSILEDSWDSYSLEALRRSVLDCEGVSLGTGGSRFDPESMALYRLMDARFGKGMDR